MGAWFAGEKWERLNRLALAAGVAIASVLLLTRPLVWKREASWLAGAVFVLLAVCCVRFCLRWRQGAGRGDAGARFKRKMTQVMWGVLLAGVMTRVVVNGLVLATLLPLEPVSSLARLRNTAQGGNGFGSWVLELEGGTKLSVEYGFWQRVPEEWAGQAVRVSVRENRLGYYVQAE